MHGAKARGNIVRALEQIIRQALDVLAASRRAARAIACALASDRWPGMTTRIDSAVGDAISCRHLLTS
jgi:hypothetical protein